MKKIMAAAVAVLGVGAAHAQDRNVEKIGAWEVITVSDPISDEDRSIAILSNGGSSLAVKCDEPGLDSIYVQFTSRKYLGGRGGRSDSRDITYRFDQGTPATGPWRYNSNYALQTDRAKVAEFVGLLSGAARVAIRGTTFDFETVTEVFEADPADTRKVLSAVYTGCRAGVAPGTASE